MEGHYIDGFVAAVSADKKEEYLDHCRKTFPVFLENGALEITEGWGDDVPDGKVTSFPLAVKAEEGEVVLFSWIRWPSKAVRDAAYPKMMEDPRMNPENNPMPFDGKRLIMGGFDIIAHTKSG